MHILSEQAIALTPQLMYGGRTIRPATYANVRSPGQHVQTINKRLGVAAGKVLDDQDIDFPFDRFTDDSYPLLPAIGVGWEEFRASHYSESELIWQPGELRLDDISGTPDGLMFEPLRIWECKFTTMKVKSVTDCWLYMKQGLCYCKMAEVNCIQFDVCWMLGDYTRPYKPVGTVTVIEFEEREIEAWWNVVVKNALAWSAAN